MQYYAMFSNDPAVHSETSYVVVMSFHTGVWKGYCEVSVTRDSVHAIQVWRFSSLLISDFPEYQKYMNPGAKLH